MYFLKTAVHARQREPHREKHARAGYKAGRAGGFPSRYAPLVKMPPCPLIRQNFRTDVNLIYLHIRIFAIFPMNYRQNASRFLQSLLLRRTYTR